MPIYEYRCENCGKFEHSQKITDQPLIRCPKCGGQVQRLISRPGIVFKGSGFHVTDYRREKSAGGGSAFGGKTEKPKETKETKSSSKETSPKPSK